MEIGRMSFTCPISSLRPLTAPPLRSHNVEFNVQRNAIIGLSVDGRGLRLTDFQNKVENALQGLLLQEVPFIDIIHGHGHGILKKWLHDHLSQSDHFSWTPVDGNDGITRICLTK